MAAEREVRVLELQGGANLDSKLLKLETGWTLKFTVAPSLYARNVRLYTDYPSPGSAFKRGQLRELPWQHSTREATWDPDRCVELLVDISGAFRYEFKCSGQDAGGDAVGGSGYFVVDPDLGYSFNGITCQTHITKLLGPLSEWLSRLQVSKECGYNMIHFTPIQQLGSSRSAYSISNQLQVDSSYLRPGFVHSNVEVPCPLLPVRGGGPKTLTVDSSLLEVQRVLQSLRKDWGLLSIVDVVWNHTSFDTPWLAQHPEAGYNLINTPHLRPAYALDVALATFSDEIVEGKWAHKGLKPDITSEEDVGAICHHLRESVLPGAKLWEYFCVDVEAVVKKFLSTVYRMNGGNHPRPEGKRLSIIQDQKYRRLGSDVDADLTLELYNIDWPGAVCFEERIEHCSDALRAELEELNRIARDTVQGQLHKAVNNIAETIRYQFLDPKGPKRCAVTKDSPLVSRYFVLVGAHQEQNLSWKEIESNQGRYVLAHNGWVMNADPLVNFAKEGSFYFQREVIIWGDSVKLRYGSRPQDSPWLWKHMSHYTQSMALLFDGFRLDNCHNTPINVAEALLDAAREVNPRLYLVAELFTPSEERDNYFINKLGINSLIREAMFAPIPYELGRLVYKYGGETVASFLPPRKGGTLKPSVAHAMFVDATHDNDPGHIQSRSVYDALPNTALVAISSCASGSCRGYDELVPHKVDVVSEARLYALWKPPGHNGEGVGMDTGIVAAKLLLNNLHKQLANDGYTQLYVDQVTDDIVAVTRHCPSSHQSVILVAYTAFRKPPPGSIPVSGHPRAHSHTGVPPLTIPGVVEEIILEAQLVDKSTDELSSSSFQQNPKWINGMGSQVLEMQSHVPIGQSSMCQLSSHSGESSVQEVVFNNFGPGSIVLFQVSLQPAVSTAVQTIRSFITGDVKASTLWDRACKAVDDLSLVDLNHVLYRCNAEERDEGKGGGVYDVPGAGSMVYCGLQGIVSMLAPVRDSNNLGHPICDNLRAGDWMAGYSVNRLLNKKATKKLAGVLDEVFRPLSQLPRFLVPCYFDAVVTILHEKVISSAISKMGSFVAEKSSLVQGLALGSVQLYGECASASLPPPTPGSRKQGSLAAGLPHFATGFMRCWGRDTFISLRGLLLLTARYQEARNTILAFAACIRHGLIPNLLSGGTNPRYNCRDAAWWWLQSIQDYCRLAPNGVTILQDDVRKIFKDADADAIDFEQGKCVPLSELVQEVVQAHVSGISFRERGAGPNLDRDMTPPGFNVTAWVDVAGTGFVGGGNVHNCGTWMDKVGESTWAENKGVPATPRDGSAVELVGLCFSAVSWLSQLHKQGVYPYSGVRVNSDHSAPTQLTFDEWSKKIKSHFEDCFWIPTDRSVASQREGEDAGYIHQTGIYKDSVGATQRYADYRLRPNFPISMVVAPELFTPDNAWTALEKAERLLLGPLGMRTLDPNDLVYNGFYFNDVDSQNCNTAKGFNYHQGPEWVWVIGYFLRAKLLFARRCGKPLDKVASSIHQVLSRHAQALRDSPWRGLPELTNKDGQECPDSCQVQAWSMACLLEVLYDLNQLT